ncbi:bifunctional folylpolyglutamate synthase/dihydrofolate synthase [Alkalihalobacterium chitinilyticum]|uniref:tetrahydrofolate synthase n=1 Tax=Alkalihalobacterium chitinilyticum TaxID=2980103 RepID=A0ABT5VAD8_9BACI|nr:folylpolyglutamate synthase/dihydrofolate synthase family protein [Alkalihalobacterium chitinilyticum]MDE5412428.1 bifunctional folylpolyglutamate synthase/dihydrofolate synthase [Alkalihalobacterium chitinilyticum]
MLSYHKANELIEQTKENKIYFGLERMQVLLEKLGNPHEKTRSIHLAGTNGKGSTLTYLRSILNEAGYRVGTFTSPYLFQRNDQIQLDGKPISQEDFVQLVEQILPVIEELKRSDYGAPVEFEVMTALAFMYFAQVENIDFVIIETGLGGRLDPTNVLTPLVAIITNIGLDHIEFLGNDLLQIANEKAGIIKPSIPLVSGCTQQEVISLLQKTAAEQQSSLHQLGSQFEVHHSNETFTYTSEQHTYTDLQLAMLGTHQQTNAALAIQTIELLEAFHDVQVQQEALRSGLQQATIKNRIEVVQTEPMVIMDGGHNQEGIKALVDTLLNSFPDKKFIVLFSAMVDKEVKEMIQSLQQLTHKIIVTTFPHPRSIQRDEIYRVLDHHSLQFVEDYKIAFHQLRGDLQEDEVLVVTGSLNFLSFVRQA